MFSGMCRVFKRRDFARWQRRERLPDAALCEAVEAMRSGLVGADLGAGLFKLRVARPGGGKRGGWRTLLSARVGHRYVFLHGFAKSEKPGITEDERRALQFAGRVLLDLPPEALGVALATGVLQEVRCEQDHRVAAC